MGDFTPDGLHQSIASHQEQLSVASPPPGMILEGVRIPEIPKESDEAVTQAQD